MEDAEDGATYKFRRKIQEDPNARQVISTKPGVLTLKLVWAPQDLTQYTKLGNVIDISPQQVINRDTNESKAVDQSSKKILLGRYSPTYNAQIPLQSVDATLTVSRQQMFITWNQTVSGMRYYAICNAALNPTTIYTCGMPIVLKKDFTVIMGESLIKFFVKGITGYEGIILPQREDVIDIEVSGEAQQKGAVMGAEQGVQQQQDKTMRYKAQQGQQKQPVLNNDDSDEDEGDGKTFNYKQLKGKGAKNQQQQQPQIVAGQTSLTIQFDDDKFEDANGNEVFVSLRNGHDIKGYSKTITCGLNETKSIVIGSSVGCEISINDGSVELEHTKITHKPQIGWMLEDIPFNNKSYPLTGVMMKSYQKYKTQQQSENIYLKKGMKLGTFGMVFEVK